MMGSCVCQVLQIGRGIQVRLFLPIRQIKQRRAAENGPQIARRRRPGAAPCQAARL